MNILSVFSWTKGEQYGCTIGEEMKSGKSMEDAIRVAYNKHGIITPSKLVFSAFSNSPLLMSMGGVVGGTYKQKVGFFNEKLIMSLIRVSKEMSLKS